MKVWQTDVKRLMLAGMFVQLSACQPAASSPDLLGREREAVQQATQLGLQMQQQLDTRMQASDAIEK